MPPLYATLDRLEGNQAVLRFDDDQELTVPASLIPTPQEGERLAVHFKDNKTDTQNRRQLAKELLEEILNPKR